jgi:hypothetical protein
MTIVAQRLRALRPDWRDPSWRRGLARALELYPPERAGELGYQCVRWQGEPYGTALLVRCHGRCRGGHEWHRVEWTADGLTCDCPSRQPCVHRARAWAEYLDDWKTLKAWSRWFGPAAAVAGVAWRETGDLESARARDPYDVRIVRDPDGTVREATGRGWPILPTGRFSGAFSFGYRGSGPNELAYCILATFFGPTLAEERRRYLVDWLAHVPQTVREFVVPARVIADAALGIRSRAPEFPADQKDQEAS